jgi:transcriptional accessory protein Tex/SPT6
VQIAQVKALRTGYEELEKRRAAILKSIDEQDKLTPELRIFP